MSSSKAPPHTKNWHRAISLTCGSVTNSRMRQLLTLHLLVRIAGRHIHDLIAVPTTNTTYSPTTAHDCNESIPTVAHDCNESMDFPVKCPKSFSSSQLSPKRLIIHQHCITSLSKSPNTSGGHLSKVWPSAYHYSCLGHHFPLHPNHFPPTVNLFCV